MALTPDDIVNYEFKQAMRGYAISQVDDLLDRLADQVERAEREIDDLRHRLRDTEARLGSTLETESTLKRTLVTAQQAAERSLEDARQQADELRGAAEREVTEQLENARLEAEELTLRAQEAARAELLSAREERAALETRLEELREVEHRHRAVLRRHLESHLAVLEDFQGLPDQGGGGQAVAPPGPPGASSLQVRVRDEEGPALEEAHDVASRAEPEPEGLFDHDPIDITDEVAVPSPWEPGPDRGGDAQSESSDAASQDEEPFPSPWGRDEGYPPPDAGQREDHRGLDDAEPEPYTAHPTEPASYRPPEPHVRPHQPESGKDGDDESEADPYEHLDQFGGYEHHEP